MEIPITLQNIKDYTQTYTLELLSIGDDLSVSGLPLQYTLDPNRLRQVKFSIIGDSNAEYASSTLKLNITNDVFSDEYHNIEIDVEIMPQSDLEFGVDGISQFVVDPEIRTNLAVNITNNALFSDDVTFSISTQSSWNWGWTMNQTNGDNAIETLSPGQLSFVYFWIEIPSVIDGSPLFETGPRFTLIASSGLDYAQCQWSFDLLMSAYRNLSVDFIGDNLTLDPGENDRISLTVRNVGNINNRISVALEAIDQLGQPIENLEISDRVEFNGWTAALFGAKEGIEILPNQDRTFEVGIQAPPDYTGHFDVRVHIYPIGDISKKYVADVSADIVWIRDGNFELNNEECLELLPGQESFRINSFVKSNIWAVLPQGQTKFKKGQIIDCFFPNFPNKILD